MFKFSLEKWSRNSGTMSRCYPIPEIILFQTANHEKNYIAIVSRKSLADFLAVRFYKKRVAIIFLQIIEHIIVIDLKTF